MMLDLNKNEQKFIESFYEQKNADLDLLFEDMRYNPSSLKKDWLREEEDKAWQDL